MPESHRTSTFIMMKKVLFMLAMLTCIFASCSDGGSEDINPTPKPDDVKYEITIDASVISNGLSFDTKAGEGSISFTTNADWTLTVASTTSGATWCKASATSGTKGSATVKFTVEENTGYEDRSVSVTIKAGTASKTFTIIQKGADALLVTTNKYEVVQEGGTIEVEVKANIDYSMEISETAKGWISEASSRALKTYKHTFNITSNDETENREGEITFKSGDKVETVKVYQAGGAIIMLTQDEYIVSDAGEMITVEIKSNIEFGVQMPDVDWIVDEASSRGMSSHTLNYYIEPNEGYDSRSAEIIFFDKNSNLQDTLKVIQAQKDAIVISEKNFNVSREGGTIEVKVNTNVDFEVQIPSDATWVSQTDSRALTEKSIYLKVEENMGDDSRSATITIINQDTQLSETIVLIQQGNTTIITLKEAGTLKSLLGDEYLNIKSLKIIGPINGDDIYYLRKMLGGNNFSQPAWGILATLDLSEATIVEGGEWYYMPNSYTECYTSNNVIGNYMFHKCANLKNVVFPNNVKSIGYSAFENCSQLSSVTIPEGVTSIGSSAFYECSQLSSVTLPEGVTSIGGSAFWGCRALNEIAIPKTITTIGGNAFTNSSIKSVYIEDMSAWCKIDFSSSLTDQFVDSNPLSCGAALFLNGKEIKELIIPEDITSIKKGAFRRCTNITKVVINDNVTSIGRFVFYGCSSLTSLSIGKSVKDIECHAFFVSSSITECYSYAIEAPTIYDSLFDWWAFVGKPEGSTLYVPTRCIESYKSKGWGKYFENIIEMEE